MSTQHPDWLGQKSYGCRDVTELMGRPSKAVVATRTLGAGILEGLRGIGVLDEPQAKPIKLSDMSVRTKASELVKLNPNAIQQIYLEQLCQTYPKFSWQNGIVGLDGARESVLKSRQQGLSTLIEAIAYNLASTVPNYVAWIVADSQPRAEGLFEMIRRFLRNDPRHPRTSNDSAKQIRFSDLDSVIRVGTAGDRNLGRSATINFLHCSEVAFWDDWSVRGGLMQAVPDSGIVFNETTANGHNEFYDFYMAGKEADGPAISRFFGWMLTPEYRIEWPGEPTDEMFEIMKKYNVDKHQAKWYCVKRKELKEADTPMEQEYPANDSEAFVSTGAHTIFPQSYLQTAMVNLKDHYEALSALEPGEGGLNGNFHVYEEPVPGVSYFCPADIAEGHVDGKGDADFSCFSVYRCDTWAQVASYWARVDPLTFGGDMAAVASWYNDAICMPENNKEFFAVYGKLLEYGLKVETMKLQGGEERSGFRTGERTKRDGDATLISLLQDAERGDPSIQIRDWRVLQELLNYGVLKNGKRGALRGHDDRVTETRIAAWYLAERQPMFRPAPKKRKPISM